MNRAMPLLLAAMALLAACAHVPRTGATEPQAQRMGEPVPDGAAIDGDRDLIVAVDNPIAAPPAHAGSNLLGYGAPDRYRSGQRALATVAELAQRYRLREIAGWPIKPLGVYCVVLRPAPGVDRAALLAELARDARVRIAEPLHEYALLSGSPGVVRYNDPYVQLQRGFADIDAALAQQVSQGKGVDVAIVDTGVDVAHPDLAGRIRDVHDMLDGSAGAAGDTRHGTEIAGVIAAVGDNHQGIVGVAPEATLSVYRACWQPAGSGGAICNTFTLAKALGALIDTPARIINLSLGGPEDFLLDQLLEVLLGQGRIVIAALPPGGRVEGFPAATPGVIVVGSTQGPKSPAGVFSAPGEDILTTQPDGRYDFSSGSSLAAAHVSGIAALLVSLSPGLDADRFRGILGDSSSTLGGNRVVNAAAAVGALGGAHAHRLASLHEDAVAPRR
jgi:hypothetical protein